jgi:hypothetical protein
MSGDTTTIRAAMPAPTRTGAGHPLASSRPPNPGVSAGCCSPDVHRSCCTPEEKGSCCGTGSGTCGCRS